MQSEYDGINVDKFVESLTCDINLALLQEGAEEFKRITEEERDAMEEMSFADAPAIGERNCDVIIKDISEIDGANIVALEKALYILGRVFKNADQIDNGELIHQIFDYLLDATCKWGLKMFQTLKNDDEQQFTDKDQLQVLVNLMQQLLPVIVQSRLYDMIGARNMSLVIKEKISEIKASGDVQNQQFKMFILSYLLVDIDIKSNVGLIEQSMSYLKAPILKYAIVVKTLYYLHFKVDELTEKNKLDVDATLRDVYRKVQKNFNNKSSKVSINNSIAAIDKKRLINKMRNK